MIINKNKKNMIVFFTFSPRNEEVVSCQAKVLNAYTDEYNLIYVSRGKTKRTMKEFERDASLPFIDENTIYLGEETGHIYDTAGEQTYEYHATNSSLHKILKEHDVELDTVINWGTSPDKAASTEKLLKYYHSSKNQTFNASIRKMYSMFIIYTLLKQNPKTKYIEHSIDPLYPSFEPDLPNKMFYLHVNSTDLHSRFDAYQFYLKNTLRIDNEKDINFVFGLTAIDDPGRLDMVYKLKKALKNEKHFYTRIHDPKHPENNINNLIPRADYNSLINRAKYTFIAPAYVDNVFSIPRLCDAVYNDCCPIIDKNCYFDVLEKDFGIEKDKIKPIIHDINADTMNFPDDKTRKEILNYLRNKLFSEMRIQLPS